MKIPTDETEDFAFALPVLLHRSHCWTLTEQQINRAEIAEVPILRVVAGYPLIDKK
jgi:hypothetical protein